MKSAQNLIAGFAVPIVIREPLTQQHLRDYAEASGDDNPIHLDEAAARKAGLPGVIAHGMLLAAFVGERALRFAREEAGLVGWTVTRVKTRFRAMTLLGDVISIGGTVKDVTPTHLHLTLTARNQRGEVTTTGEITLSPAARVRD